MKKLLLLFVPLVFFFSCEEGDGNPTGYNCAATGCVESASSESGYYLNLEDCENNCWVNCSCGIVTAINYTPEFFGYVTPGPDGGNDTIGALPAYNITIMENICTGQTMSVCENVNIGETFCGNEATNYTSECQICEDFAVFNPDSGQFVETAVLQQTEIIDGQEIYTYFDPINYNLIYQSLEGTLCAN